MAEIIQVNSENPDARVIQRAGALLTSGEVIVCPTDTGYALAANALDEEAVSRVFLLKGRNFANPVHVAVSSFAEAEKYAYINEVARKLAKRFLPGALTLVLVRKSIIPSMLVAGKETVGIRVPDNKIILAVAELTGVPLTATSANASGQPTPYSIREVTGSMGEDVKKIALMLDQGPISPRELSTIVDVSVTPPRLVRQGRIPWETIQKVIAEEGD